jgi:hypothetical protein
MARGMGAQHNWIEIREARQLAEIVIPARREQEAAHRAGSGAWPVDAPASGPVDRAQQWIGQVGERLQSYVAGQVPGRAATFKPRSK